MTTKLKAYEVHVYVPYSYKDRTEMIFLCANSEEEIRRAEKGGIKIKSIHHRLDISPDECDHYLYKDNICVKDVEF